MLSKDSLPSTKAEVMKWLIGLTSLLEPLIMAVIKGGQLWLNCSHVLTIFEWVMLFEG